MSRSLNLSDDELDELTDRVADRLAENIDELLERGRERAELKEVIRGSTDAYDDEDLAAMSDGALRATAAEVADTVTANAVSPSDGPDSTGTYAEYRADD